MPSPQLIDLGRRLIANLQAGRTDLGDHVFTGDGSVFTDRDLWDREREVLFRRTPQVMGWAGEVSEPGDVLARIVAGVPVLVTRDADGEVRAFLNSCTHRGMGLCDGADNTRRLTCGYHGWTFDLAGRLVGLPQRERFPGLDTERLGLQPLPVELQAGMIVVGLRPDVDVAAHLDDIIEPTSWMGYDRYRGGCTVRLVTQANWKLMLDVNIEAYHVPSLHRQSLEPFLADACAVDHWGPHTRMVVPFKGIEALADQPEDTWPERINSVMVTTLFPATVVIDHASGGSILRLDPGSHPGETHVTMVEARPGPLDDEAVKQCEAGMEANLRILADEDFPAAESCQRGYEAGNRSVVGGLGEPLIGHWHEAWAAAVLS